MNLYESEKVTITTVQQIVEGLADIQVLVTIKFYKVKKTQRNVQA